MRILVFGASGMLGHKLVQTLAKDADLWTTVRSNFSSISKYSIIDESKCILNIDATDVPTIWRAIDSVKPDVVINAIGIVKQLPTSKDVISALTVNSIFPHRLAQLSAEFGYRLITLSTDCVFDGSKGNYSEDDLPNASDLYGKSKNLGEVDCETALTLRTSIIGREIGTAHSLVEWFLSNKGKSVPGFTNAMYTGFPTIVLADIIRSLIFDFPDLSGIYHVSSEPISKYDLLLLLNEFYDAGIKIEPSDEVRIDRSLNSNRFRRATGFEPEDWQRMIERMAYDPTPYDEWN